MYSDEVGVTTEFMHAICCLCIYIYHLAATFIQSDLQIRRTRRNQINNM